MKPTALAGGTQGIWFDRKFFDGVLMLLLLFVIFILQIFLFPGLVALSYLRPLHYIDRILLAIPVSFLINYLIVVFLVMVGGYTQSVMLYIFGAETAVLLIINRRIWPRFLDLRIPDRYQVTFNISKAFTLEGFVKFVSFGSVAYLYVLCFKQIGSVISDWDGVVSWSRWALSWYNGMFPDTVWSYPQILPILYSISYKFVNSPDIFIAPKLVPIFICVVIPITAIRLAFLLRKTLFLEILLAVPVSIYLMRNLVNPDYVFSGGADMASAYFGLVCIYSIALSKTIYGRVTNADYYQLMFWLAVATATSFLIKQAAIFASAFFSLGWYWVTRKLPMPNRQIILLGIWLLAVMIPAHFYLYIYLNSSNPILIVTMYEQFLKTVWYLRPYEGAKMLYVQLGWWPFIFFGFGAWIKPFRVLLVPLITVYLAWAFYASYDVRNLYVALPLFSFLIAAGVILVIKFAIRNLPFRLFGWLNKRVGEKSLSFFNPLHLFYRGENSLSFFSSKAYGLLVMATLLGLIYSLSMKDYYPRAIDKSFREQMKIGNERMNYFLYEKFREKFTGSGVVIATDYQIMRFLPKLDEFYYHAHSTSLIDFSVAFMNKRTKFILITIGVKDVAKYVDEGLIEDKFRLLYEANGARLLEIVEPKKNCNEYLRLNPASSWGKCQ